MLADRAKYSIYVNTYISKPDNVGNSLFESYKRAIKRGVNVYFLVDSGGSLSLTHAELKALQEYASKYAGFRTDPKTGLVTKQKAQVHTVVFNPMNIGTKMLRNFVRRAFNLTAPRDSRVDIVQSWINRRSHAKGFGIDFESLDAGDHMWVTGGRNLDESYYAIPQYGTKTYNDVEVLVRNAPGAAVGETISAEVADFYNKILYHIGNKWLSRSIVAVLFGLYDKHLEAMETTYAKNLGREDIKAKLQKMNDDKYLDEGFEDVESSLLTTIDNVLRHHVADDEGGMDNPANAKLVNPSHIYSQILEAINQTEKEIIITTPYPDFTPKMVELLESWLAGDKERRLIVFTNSIMTSDNMPAQINVDQNVGRLFGNTAQTKVWEYGQMDAIQLGGKVPYPKVHAKFLIFDRKRLMVGTFNLDERSDFLNVENMMDIRVKVAGSPFIMAYVNQTMKWIGQSYLVGSPEWIQLRTNHKLAQPKRFVATDGILLRAIMQKFNLEWIF